ncbi:MAG: hypothetical protein JW999_07855 [Methanotrichaceae archaeon]|nr:hypothetical protein [Methanotrichaceae archaeon]
MKKSSRIVIFGLMVLGIIIAGGLIPSSATEISELGFTPSGWIGDYEGIKFSDTYSDPERGPCIRIDYPANGSEGAWVGIYWLFPSSNWGELPGKNVEGYKSVTFFARGEVGGEEAEFMVGGVDAGEANKDSIQPPRSTGPKILKKDWEKYEIDLSGLDLSRVIGGFCWVTDMGDKAAKIYLDDINYIK